MGNMTKIAIFVIFSGGTGDPAGRYINLKTIEKVFRDLKSINSVQISIEADHYE